jgi:hypothetical protein
MLQNVAEKTGRNSTFLMSIGKRRALRHDDDAEQKQMPYSMASARQHVTYGIKLIDDKIKESLDAGCPPEVGMSEQIDR